MYNNYLQYPIYKENMTKTIPMKRTEIFKNLIPLHSNLFYSKPK